LKAVPKNIFLPTARALKIRFIVGKTQNTKVKSQAVVVELSDG